MSAFMVRGMRSGLLASILTALGCGMAASVCGCHADECIETLTCTDGLLDDFACNADPALGPAENDCGVFVSSSSGDDANPGTRDKPVRTLERAISLARTGPLRVYACAEVFPEAVTVPSGVEVWGGLDCARDWSYLGGKNRTVLAPGPDLIPLQVEKGEEGRISTLADLRIEAADASMPGGSSIAMLVLTGAAVELRRSELVAGDGADGEPGERGGEQPAKGGAPGNSGAAACSADSVLGAPPAITVCGGAQTLGGKGGDGNAARGGSGNDGQPEPVPNPDGLGLGGSGEVSGAQCLPGQVGENGTDGAHGLGGRGAGRITFQGWEGERGGDGGNGRYGQGGGGGGGSRGGSVACGLGPNKPKGGASGGSGGGGGCGGKGGRGGGFGGSSIGLVSFSGDVSLEATSIVTGNGGDGGTGGLAQLGGAPGVSGIGGSSVGGSHVGCDGGNGGSGGNGGYGGGGLGGASIGVAHLSGQLPGGHDVPIKTGMPGKGGPGGNEAVTGSAGEDGTKGDTLGFPQ